MTKQQIFWKALHSLSHPISIAAILLLLFNDHWLRYNYPSWLTGKLGDFTWLIFAPFIAALLFACLIPTRYSKKVGFLSFTFIGLWFATAKTIPFVHHITTETLYALVGWRGTLRMDASDLLTLPALLIGWQIWQQASSERINLRPVAYVAFGLGILGTMATSPNEYFYDTGIINICRFNDILLLQLPYENIYQSDDGGFRWQETDVNELNNEPPQSPQSWFIDNTTCPENNAENTLITPQSQFRWIDNERITISYDEGQTWHHDYDLIEARQDVRIFYARQAQGESLRIFHEDLPINAIYDPISGNVLFSMGWNGILIRTPDSNYHWVSVDDYGLQDLSLNIQSDSLLRSFAPLKQQGYFMLGLSTLVLITLMALLAPDEDTMPPLIATTGWGLWVFLVLLISPVRIPPILFDLHALVTLVIMWAGIILGIPVTFIALIQLLKHYRSTIISLLITIVLASAGYIFPYLLWLQGTVPRYLTAAVFSLLLTGTILYACYVFFKPRLPERYEPEKQKHKNEEVLA